MDPIGFFLLLTSLLFSYPFVLIAQSPTTTISVEGIVYCDACSTGTFSKHSYLLPGVDVHIECRFRASSPRTNEQINFSVNRTTDREGAYKLNIPSVDGTNCEIAMDGNSQIVTLCEASLIGTSSSSYSCNVPFLKSTGSSEISKQENNLCVYSLGALSYKPPENMINTTLCSN